MIRKFNLKHLAVAALLLLPSLLGYLPGFDLLGCAW
jgi:hypothetical protein